MGIACFAGAVGDLFFGWCSQVSCSFYSGLVESLDLPDNIVTGDYSCMEMEVALVR